MAGSFSTARFAPPKPGQYHGGYLGQEEIPFSFEQNREADTIGAMDARTTASMGADLERNQAVAALRNMGYGREGQDPQREREQEQFGMELKKAVLPAQAQAERYIGAAQAQADADVERQQILGQTQRDVAGMQERSRLTGIDMEQNAGTTNAAMRELSNFYQYLDPKKRTYEDLTPIERAQYDRMIGILRARGEVD